MGTWGTGLYSSDTACDVRDTFRDLVKLPLGAAELRDAMVAQFGMGNDPLSESETDFWLALADQFHAYGLDDTFLARRAREIIETGADLAGKRDLGMEPPDIKQRSRVLDELLAKWARPHPKPRKRVTIAGPEEFALEVGDCLAYPAMDHYAMPYTRSDFDPKSTSTNFIPNGWGAFVVLDRWHYRGFRARYLIAVVYLENDVCPSVEDVGSAPIDGFKMQEQDMHLETVASCYMKNPRRELKLLNARKIGTIKVDLARLREATNALVHQVHGSERGDMQLGGLLSLRKPDPWVSGSRDMPCMHLRLADFQLR